MLICAALKEELYPYFEAEEPLYTGIGKINATYHLTKTLAKNSDIDLVVNFGTAASARIPKGEVVQCDRIYERDMMCQLEEFTQTNPLFYQDLTIKLPFTPKADCFTGDSFLNYFQCQSYAGMVDMEAFALAKVCSYFRIPFVSFKAITDGMSPNSETDWRAALNSSAKQFRVIYDLIRKTRCLS